MHANLFIKSCFKCRNIDFDEFNLISLPTKVLFYSSFKMSQKISGLTSRIVLLIRLGLLLIAQLLMLLRLSKNLLVVVLLLGLLISLDCIRYSCDLNLSRGFFMTLGSKLLQLIGINYVSLWTNSLVIFHIWKIKFFLIELAKVLESPIWKRHLCPRNMGWR